MRKYLAIILAVAFVLGLGASAYADQAVAAGDTKLTLSGELRVRGEMQQNTNDFNNDAGHSWAYYDQRVRLGIEAKAGKTTGKITLQTNGGGTTTDVYNWGGAVPGGSRGVYQISNDTRDDMKIYEAWIKHSFDSAPVGVWAGHIPIKLGRGLFFDHTKQGTDALIFFADPTKELHLGLATVKLGEGTGTTTNDDKDAYVALGVYKINKDSSVGLNVAKVVDRNFYGLGTGAVVAGKKPQVDMYNAGLNVDGKVAGIGYYVDVEYQWGDIKEADADLSGNARKLKVGGNAVLLGVNYTIDPVKLSVEYARGSGDEYNLDKNGDGVRDNTKYKNYISSLGADKHYTYVYEYRTARQGVNSGLQPFNGTWGNVGANNSSMGLVNTQYLMVAADATLMKDLTANLSYYWLQAVKATALGFDKSGTMNPARVTLPASGGGNVVSNHKTSKDIGSEVDFNVTYNISKNLKYWVEGGYLFVGSAMDYCDTAGTTPSNTNKSGDDAYAIRHGLQFNF